MSRGFLLWFPNVLGFLLSHFFPGAHSWISRGARPSDDGTLPFFWCCWMNPKHFFHPWEQVISSSACVNVSLNHRLWEKQPKSQLLTLGSCWRRGKDILLQQVSEMPDVLSWMTLISVSFIAKVCFRHDRNRQGEFPVQE